MTLYLPESAQQARMAQMERQLTDLRMILFLLIEELAPDDLAVEVSGDRVRADRHLPVGELKWQLVNRSAKVEALRVWFERG